MNDSKCKICRRAGIKLFLRGDRCLSQKCPMVKKPYPPGPKAKKRVRALSEYGKELREKQKLKNWYNLEEKQFSNYVKAILKARGKVADAGTALIKTLESRLDNVVFKLGFAPSKLAARQMVSHRHFMVNARPVNISSYLVKKGDKISIHPNSLKKASFQRLSSVLKKYNPPSWLKLDADRLEAKVIDLPNLEEAAPPAELSAIFEFYSK
ncbi:MAG: 30S ribosomal protein S4 [Candidatus Nealsonbacteria bacterium RBG_13_38_11]|uniref:Small ribosomal subunit protein uS4 n=1 Tax=Candidatus Nealsonbacteria bacterium RBG_13_38_11 TaxID=1801662 RepID=A0A1G2E1R5_9BACT|nr:MAG: 30S ribosomal protein S4 [Candidatus Nealsonbacteria bacterium RBG_13_38_11]